MGCNIHVHVEIKVKGRWLHYNHPYVRRNYWLFGKMAGVRNYDNVKPISKPKGFPDDASETTALDFYEQWGVDAHSASWLSSEEVKEFSEWFGKQPGRDQGDVHGFEGIFGYLFGNTLAGFSKYPEDQPDFLEDFRIVFWFDN
jgi:hypothetical protein